MLLTSLNPTVVQKLFRAILESQPVALGKMFLNLYEGHCSLLCINPRYSRYRVSTDFIKSLLKKGQKMYYS